MHLFISGPIRPSLNDVLTCVRTIKSQLPPCKVWFSTWSTQISLDELRAEVDVLIVIPEPTVIPATTTLEGRDYPHLTTGVNARIYKMFSGIENIFTVAPCSPDDIVIRFRSDMLANFTPGFLNKLLEAAKYGYVVRKRAETSVCDFDDCFAISTYKNMKNVWCFRTLGEFEDHMSHSHNAEHMVKRKVLQHSIPILYLDETKIDFCLLRAGDKKYYCN
jgi:hypothetical protein